MNNKWILGGGRNIETPEGTFYLTYGSDSNGNPHFRDFVLLDKIARQVALLPELLDALQSLASHAEDFASELSADHYAVKEARAVIAKAKGGE